jgi:hypothetical protein
MFLVPNIYILDHYNSNVWFSQNNAEHPFDNLSASNLPFNYKEYSQEVDALK